jgi:undecaprenyl-diphosphatase
MIFIVLLKSVFSYDWLNWLNKLDTFIFFKINTVYTSSFFDTLFPWYREGNTWIPLYLFLILFVIVNFKKSALQWIIFVVITLLLTDQLSSSIVKPFFERLRPCTDPNLMSKVRLLLNHCSGGFSFTSSHATNHFGFAVFIMMTLGHIFRKWKYLFLIWAASVSYGQIYVGVHYPFDILGGALLGSTIGWLTASFYIRRIGLPVFT